MTWSLATLYRRYAVRLGSTFAGRRDEGGVMYSMSMPGDMIQVECQPGTSCDPSAAASAGSAAGVRPSADASESDSQNA